MSFEAAIIEASMSEFSPENLALRQYKMSQRYNELCTELAGLKKNKATEWLELRKETKTNKEADMQWEASENGQRYLEIKTLLDGLSKELSSGNALGYVLRSNNY